MSDTVESEIWSRLAKSQNKCYVILTWYKNTLAGQCKKNVVFLKYLNRIMLILLVTIHEVNSGWKSLHLVHCENFAFWSHISTKVFWIDYKSIKNKLFSAFYLMNTLMAFTHLCLVFKLVKKTKSGKDKVLNC